MDCTSHIEYGHFGKSLTSSQLITRLYYSFPAFKMFFFCKKFGCSYFCRVTCILSQVPIQRLTLLKHSYLHNRQWYLLHTFLKMTPLPYISRTKRINFWLAFRGYSQVLGNRCEKFILPQMKVKAQNTSAVQRENWWEVKLLSTYDCKSWQSIHCMQPFYSFLSHLAVTLTQVYIILILWSLGGDSEILWTRVVRVASSNARNKILHL